MTDAPGPRTGPAGPDPGSGPGPSDTIVVRRAVASDDAFLRRMLAVAADWRPGAVVRSAAEVVQDPAIAHYVEGWPRDGDVGVVAVDGAEPVGAAWARFAAGGTTGYGFVAADVPELTIGVVADRRGRGVGRRLLTALIAAARRDRIDRISLSVEADNPASALCLDLGFTRVGGTDDAPTMLLDRERGRVGGWPPTDGVCDGVGDGGGPRDGPVGG